jgi:uncharacterized protein YlxW (UPF0749 family)
MKKYSQPALIFTGLLVGFLIVLQSRSFHLVEDIYGRDTRANAFHEIQVLKKTNENLQEEIKELESNVAQISDREQALKVVDDEIKKYTILAARSDVKGPGVEIILKENVPVIWLTDLVNELWSNGAEAVSINHIRLTNGTTGFDTIPNGQISLNGEILHLPYTLQAIGDKKVLIESLNQRQGILERLKESFPKLNLSLNQKEEIKMSKETDGQ